MCFKKIKLTLFSVCNIKSCEEEGQYGKEDECEKCCRIDTNKLVIGINLGVWAFIGLLYMISIAVNNIQMRKKQRENRNSNGNLTKEYCILALNEYYKNFPTAQSVQNCLQNHVQALQRIDLSNSKKIKAWKSELYNFYNRFGIIEFNERILFSREAVQSSLLDSADEDLKNLPDFVYSEQSKNEIKQMIKNLKSNKDYRHMIDILKQYKLKVEMQSPTRLRFVRCFTGLVKSNVNEDLGDRFILATEDC